MHLYEINNEILNLLTQLEIDEETGEYLASSEEIFRKLDSLDMERHRIMEYLAKVVLETRAESAALKAEEDRLAKRRHICEHKEERLLQVLDRECDGKKTDLGVATFRYRAASHVDVQDQTKTVNWLRRHKLQEYIRVRDPEIDKAAIRRMLCDGKSIPGVELVTTQSYSLK